MLARALKKKIADNKLKVAVVGLGYVGLPLAVTFAKRGFNVYGIDKDSDRVRRLERKENYISDVADKDLLKVLNNGKFSASVHFDILSEADVIIVCVPTPLRSKYAPDVSFIVQAVKVISKYMKKGALVVVESTTYPGTTKELIKPVLEKRGFKAGRDFFLAFSPERIDPGNKTYDVTKIPKIVGGITPQCAALTKMLYEKVIKTIHSVSSAEAAEMTKLIENSFRIINIGWINEVAMMCHKIGIDVWEVIEAAKTKPFGFMPFYPGLGVGGHCIPDDPLYLYWRAKQYGFNSKYIKLSADTNSHMPAYAVERMKDILAGKKKPLHKAKLLVLGVTYKKDVKDLRKSPPLKMIGLLQHRKCKVDYSDPIIPFLDIGSIKLQSVKLNKANLAKYDLVVIATDHSDINYNAVLRSSRLIFDIKNVFAKHKSEKIIKF